VHQPWHGRYLRLIALHRLSHAFDQANDGWRT